MWMAALIGFRENISKLVYRLAVTESEWRTTLFIYFAALSHLLVTSFYYYYYYYYYYYCCCLCSIFCLVCVSVKWIAGYGMNMMMMVMMNGNFYLEILIQSISPFCFNTYFLPDVIILRLHCMEAKISILWLLNPTKWFQIAKGKVWIMEFCFPSKWPFFIFHVFMVPLF